MRIAIGCDHRGLNLKQSDIKLLTDAGHSYEDFVCSTTDPVDYPDIAQKVAEAIARGNCARGILICITGLGMCMAANKVKGIRAALCDNAFSARRARQHNDANILCLGVESGQDSISGVVEAYLAGEFEGGSHHRRLNQIRDTAG